MVRERRQQRAARHTRARPLLLLGACAAAGVIAVTVVSLASDGPEATEPDPAAPEPSGEPGVSVDETVIEVVGPERNEDDIGALQTVLGAWGAERGISVTYAADPDWEANIRRRVDRDDPPDISIFSRVDILTALAREGHLVALGGEALAAVDNWGEAWTAFGEVDGTQYGVPVEADLNSLVWYRPQAFADAGYDVPTTFHEFTALVDEIAAADGPRPLCVGIQSGQSTGWVYAEWVADVVLRQHGPDTYDRWVTHGIPFDDQRIVDSMQTVLDMWSDDHVFASGGTIASTPFQDNGVPLVDGRCFMHRQASFFSIFFPEDTPFADGSPTAVDVFVFPNDDGTPSVLGSATLAAGFGEDPNVQALLAYMATPDYAEARQAAQRELALRPDASSGFLSGAIGQDVTTYNLLERRFVDILENAATVRLDINQTLPSEVASAFWSEGAAAVSGERTAAEAAEAIEASWPS